MVCGCFLGTLEEFQAKVRKTHGENEHAKRYLAAADFAEVMIAKEEKTDG